MSILDGVLGQAMGGLDLAGLAGKVGLTPQQAESALAALTRAQPEPGNTAGLAAAKTELPVETMQQILGHLGGEGALSQVAAALGDQGGLGRLAGLWGSGAGPEGNR